MPAKAKPNNTTASLGFDAKLWLAADMPRNNEEMRVTSTINLEAAV